MIDYEISVGMDPVADEMDGQAGGRTQGGRLSGRVVDEGKRQSIESGCME
jgi:hypothetical protein